MDESRRIRCRYPILAALHQSGPRISQPSTTFRRFCSRAFAGRGGALVGRRGFRRPGELRRVLVGAGDAGRGAHPRARRLLGKRGVELLGCHLILQSASVRAGYPGRAAPRRRLAAADVRCLIAHVAASRAGSERVFSHDRQRRQQVAFPYPVSIRIMPIWALLAETSFNPEQTEMIRRLDSTSWHP